MCSGLGQEVWECFHVSCSPWQRESHLSGLHRGQTALHKAAVLNQKTVCHYLVEAGASLTKTDLQVDTHAHTHTHTQTHPHTDTHTHTHTHTHTPTHTHVLTCTQTPSLSNTRTYCTHN